MPKIDTPIKLKPYLFHGLDLSWDDSKQATGACPACDRPGKFSISLETGLYRCWHSACAIKGNDKGFIRWLWEISDETMKWSTANCSWMLNDRNLLYPETLMHWGVVRSVISGGWLVPGYGVNGNINQLYKYTPIKGKLRLMPTPTLGHQLFGRNLYDKSKPVVYLCEGPWDAMVLWEVLAQVKETENGFRLTANQQHNLLAQSNVLAVPGCDVFVDSWIPLFTGKHVILLYDNDHPIKDPKNGKLQKPSGYRCMQKVAGKLSSAKEKEQPESIHYLHWGEQGYDPNLPKGYDVRDFLTKRASSKPNPTD